MKGFAATAPADADVAKALSAMRPFKALSLS
jgi:hypothetical protein